MSDETQPADGLEPVDHALAASLTEQGPDGARALGLLRDAHRMLGDDRFEQPGEIADSCIRNAVDALLSLPGAADPKIKVKGLQSTAKALLDAVDSYETPHDGPPKPVSKAAKKRRTRDPQEALPRIRQAADQLRPEIYHPGGYHRRRARNIAERLMGQQLGAAQDNALDAWGKIYGETSDTLHGTASQAAAAHYRQVLRLAREVFVPLPGRAQEILELAELQDPTQADADRLAEWADPRATRYFFLSRPVPGWLDLLDDILLTPDTQTPHGSWPAAPYLDHLTQEHPDRVRQWLGEHAQAAAAAGPDATAALLRLTARPGITLTAQIRKVVTDLTRPEREPRPEDGRLLRAAADWAQDVAPADRDEHWVRAVEGILSAAVRADHATHRQTQALAEDGSVTDAEARESLSQLVHAVGLPDWETSQLLATFVNTAHHRTRTRRPAAPTPGVGQPHPQVHAMRHILASLLRLDIELTDEASRHAVVFHRDLSEVSLERPEAFLGPVVARAVLDLAAADAHAGVALAERTAAMAGKPLQQADPRLCDRLLATHLEETGPDALNPDPTTERTRWWETARPLVAALMAHRPTPEGARLTDRVSRLCPPDEAEALHTDVAHALGTPPTTEELAAHDLASTRPPRTWLQAWDWSPVLPKPVTDPWEPTLTLLRTRVPQGPADPRAAEPFLTIDNPEPPAVTADHVRTLTLTQGPVQAATALSTAPDAPDSRYLRVLRTAIDSDPIAWTTAPADIAAALARPELRAYYLAIAADHTRTTDAFPGQALAEAAATALAWTPAESTDADEDEPPAVYRAQALFDLLTALWRSDADLGNHLPAVLDYLYGQTAPLATPAPGPDEPPADPSTRDFVGADPAGRALQCLLEHARTTGEKLPDRLHRHLTAVITTTGRTARTAAALGPYLPQIRHQAPTLLHEHRTALLALPHHGTSAASTWLRWGPLDPQLLTELDRPELLARLREATPPEAFHHTAHALLTDRTILGDPQDLFTELALTDDGPAAASTLLERIAHHTRSSTTQPQAVRLWQHALAASLPPGALAGAGAFAALDIDDTTWLTLTLTSARHTPQLTSTKDVAQRAAAHLGKEDAAQIAALLVLNPSPEPWEDAAVRTHARRLLTDAGNLPDGQRPDAALQELREALVTAGDVAAHRLGRN
ncbi:hypothetical protein ACFW96_27530 [Streptomyces gardneri]|uniref:hypothetical protein n=1 Tax=Streptomyces gardneri TaxID=66892 RepID=UPI00368C5C1E